MWFYEWVARRAERKAARRYDRAISTPLSTGAAAYLRQRLESGTAARRRALRRECDVSRSRICFNQSEGFEACAMDAGECIHRQAPDNVNSA